MAESEDELKSFLINVKKQNEKEGLKLNINKNKKQRKLRSWHLVPSLHEKYRASASVYRPQQFAQTNFKLLLTSYENNTFSFVVLELLVNLNFFSISV